MKHALPSLAAALACLVVAPFATAAFTEDFSGLDAWVTYKAGAGALDAEVAEGSLKLATETAIVNPAETRTVRAITKAASSDLNPFTGSEPVDIVFNDLAIQSAGATTTFLLGITPDNANANIYGRSNSLYFAQNGTANAQLVLRDGGAATTVWSTTTASELSLSYSSIAISLTATTWSLALYDQTGTALVNTSGLLTTPANAGWQSALYMSLTLNQSSGTAGTAATTLLLGGINASQIPEPATIAALLGAIAAGCVALLRRRSR
ncbi:hypothetical protein OPIT5_30070 [Opitutaceae bacterium TAV5]|nr:hypothetical protein OPIT5_30070 [Opitutaceae bacterium TAV5]